MPKVFKAFDNSGRCSAVSALLLESSKWRLTCPVLCRLVKVSGLVCFGSAVLLVRDEAFAVAKHRKNRIWSRLMSRNKGSMSSMLRRFGLAFVLVVLLAGASSAYADTILNYQITQTSGIGNSTVNFTLAMHPTPSGGNSSAFSLLPLQAYLNGAPAPITVTPIFTSSFLGGSILGLFGFAFAGPQQLYSWSNSSPTMYVGNFTLTGGTLGSVGTYRLTVISVPEPKSFILLVVGLLALFGIQLLRRFA